MHLLPGIADRWIWQADLDLPDRRDMPFGAMPSVRNARLR